MMRRVQAAILGGLVSVAAFCACACLSFPVVFVAALAEMDDHRPRSEVARSTIVFRVSLVLSVFAGLRMGWRVGRDWYRNTPPRSRAGFAQT